MVGLINIRGKSKKTIHKPLPGKPAEFKQFISAHDNWLFSFPENLKLHNRVCRFEQAQATEVEKRLKNIEHIDPLIN